MTPDGIALRHSTVIDDVRNTLVGVYADARADQLHLLNYSVERFGEQLARHGSDPSWEVVIGHDAEVPVGFAYCDEPTSTRQPSTDGPILTAIASRMRQLSATKDKSRILLGSGPFVCVSEAEHAP